MRNALGHLLARDAHRRAIVHHAAYVVFVHEPLATVKIEQGMDVAYAEVEHVVVR